MACSTRRVTVIESAMCTHEPTESASILWLVVGAASPPPVTASLLTYVDCLSVLSCAPQARPAERMRCTAAASAPTHMLPLSEIIIRFALHQSSQADLASSLEPPTQRGLPTCLMHPPFLTLGAASNVWMACDVGEALHELRCKRKGGVQAAHVLLALLRSPRHLLSRCPQLSGSLVHIDSPQLDLHPC